MVFVLPRQSKLVAQSDFFTFYLMRVQPFFSVYSAIFKNSSWRSIHSRAGRGVRRLLARTAACQPNHVIGLPVVTSLNAPDLRLSANYMMRHSRKAVVSRYLLQSLPSLRSNKLSLYSAPLSSR